MRIDNLPTVPLRVLLRSAGFSVPLQIEEDLFEVEMTIPQRFLAALKQRRDDKQRRMARSEYVGEGPMIVIAGLASLALMGVFGWAFAGLFVH